MVPDTSGPQQLVLRTEIVDGPLALRMRRLDAARIGTIGLQILTLPQLAARLAGGFSRPAGAADLERAARDALAAGGFAEITPLAELPGMVRAVVRTLERLWRAGIALGDHRAQHPRLADLALIEARVRTGLSGGACAPPDLMRAALSRRHLFATLAGETRFVQVHHVSRMWRPLIEALAETSSVTWCQCLPPSGWAAGTTEVAPSHRAPVAVATCANPQAEAVEALRWARMLVASGIAKPSEIAIVAASPHPWDDVMLGLAAGASLPIHFSHGVPALCSIEGQTCAALIDLLEQGLSYGRVQRLIGHSGGRCPALPLLPGQPLAGVPAGAALNTLAQWRRALRAAAAARSDQFDIASALEPMLVRIAEGMAGAEAAGADLLPHGAAALWRTALRRAPPAALPFTLTALRIADGKDPGANIVFGPASHLTGAPRPWMRLVGMTSRAWPRPRRDDPLLPGHILAIDPALSPDRPELDRQRFAALCRGTRSGLVFSYARQTAKGGAQAPSPLLPAGVDRLRLARMRTPEHAYSESDRLQARPRDGLDRASLARPVACARARRKPILTPFDGPVRADHPLVLETLAEVQSSASLRLLLRDPQAFVWRYALGWHATLEEAQTLSLDDRAFGELVHQLLQYTVITLEGGPGFARAAAHEIENALGDVRERIRHEWPTLRPTPPPMLWQHLLDKAAAMAMTALQLDPSFQPGTRSWTEVGFGDSALQGAMPWDPAAPVSVPGTGFAVRGRIDRIEVAAGDKAVRITDYKTGRAPINAASLVLAGGREMQRVLYAIAARQHLPEAGVRADLVYLGDPAPVRHRLPDIDSAVIRVAALLNAADGLVRRGISLPGPDAEEHWSAYRLARPAVGEPMPRDKKTAIATAFAAIEQMWREP